MKLRFLGQTYSSSLNRVETIASEHTVRFLGRKYALRLPTQTANSSLGIKKKYRGITYDA